MADHLFGITDTGMVRKNNEDVFLAETLMDGQFLLAGVIDGVGGYEGGEVAAAVTKEVLLNELEQVGREVITQLVIAFNLSNEEIIGRKLLDKKLSDMACVATVAVIDKQNNVFHYIHVGDTRLYLFRDNSLVKISKDQSFVGFLEESGRLTEVAAMQHPKRNEINQALGLESREEMTENYFETGSSPFLPGDLLLICSDGLTDMIGKDEIAAVLGTADPVRVKAAQLIAQANAAGGEDNVTVVLVKNDKAPVLHEVSKPEPKAIVAEPKAIITELKPEAADTGRMVAESKVIDDNKYDKLKKNNSLLILLSLFCIVFLAATIWLSLDRFSPSNPKNIPIAVIVPPMNAQEKWITDSLLKLKGDTLLLSEEVLKGTVKLTRALHIDQDTLIIKTKGNILFQPDSAYRGPALILSAACKYVSINNLVISSFDTGIVSYQNALELKNVQFNQCKHPLQVMFEFPNHFYVNGRVSKRSFQTDSLSKK